MEVSYTKLLKINGDAARMVSTQVGGGGWVILDEHGICIIAGCCGSILCSSTVMEKAEALRSSKEACMALESNAKLQMTFFLWLIKQRLMSPRAYLLAYQLSCFQFLNRYMQWLHA